MVPTAYQTHHPKGFKISSTQCIPFPLKLGRGHSKGQHGTHYSFITDASSRWQESYNKRTLNESLLSHKRNRNPLTTESQTLDLGRSETINKHRPGPVEAGKLASLNWKEFLGTDPLTYFILNSMCVSSDAPKTDTRQDE